MEIHFIQEDNLSSLNMNGSVVLIDLDGMDKDISNKWVKIQCSSRKVYSIVSIHFTRIIRYDILGT
jgi:hypothetical protein